MNLSAMFKRDGWSNIFTGMGIRGRDKNVSTKYATTARLQPAELDQIYEGDGLGRCIVDVHAETMTREWIGVEAGEGGEGEAIIASLEELDAKKNITDLIRWSRLHGGALCLLGMDDGQADLSQPLNEASLRKVVFLAVYDRSEIVFNSTDIYTDPANPKYGQPEFYNISPAAGNIAQFKVHESRVLRMDGDPLPSRARAMNQYWGASLLQAPYDALRNLGTAYAGCVQIVGEFAIATLTMKNLADMIGAGNEDLVMKRLSILDMSKSMLNMILLDEEETFSRSSASIAGLPDLLDRFVNQLAATCRMPVTVLMGQAPAGLNATGDSDIRSWYDSIAAEQQDRLLPVLNRLVRLMLIAKDGPTKGKEPQDWRIEFKPLWQMSEKETAEIRKSTAEADQIYITNGVLDPGEVRAARFGGAKWSMETTVTGDAPEPITETKPKD